MDYTFDDIKAARLLGAIDEFGHSREWRSDTIRRAWKLTRRYRARITELERWKREALEVLARWDAVAEKVPVGAKGLGRLKADLVADRIVELEAENRQLGTDHDRMRSAIADLDYVISTHEIPAPPQTDPWSSQKCPICGDHSDIRAIGMGVDMCLLTPGVSDG